MQEVIHGDPAVLEGLAALCTGNDAIQHTGDVFGNSYHWFRLDKPTGLWRAAEILHAPGARLAQIAAYNQHRNSMRMQAACYEFVLNGIVYNVTANMDDEHPEVPSITPLFANADWHEREMMELYGVRISNHPNPRRLFLDEELDKGLLGEIVPLSVMMNGASSSDLWEHIIADKEKGQ